jgi:ribosomal protein S18 acetylase RimI-like enzyme
MMRGNQQTLGDASLVVRRLPPVDSPAESEEAEAVTRWLEEVAREEGWQPGGELRAYHGRSTYLALYETDETADQRLIGALQIVLPDIALDTDIALPCQRVWPELDLRIPTAELAHVLVLAVRPEWRRTGVYWQLCLSLWRYCVEAGIRELWMEATPTMLRCYRLLGWPLVVRGPLRVHWGEPCFPYSLSPCEVAGTLARKSVTSSTYRTLLLCAVRPADPVEYPAPPH